MLLSCKTKGLCAYLKSCRTSEGLWLLYENSAVEMSEKVGKNNIRSLRMFFYEAKKINVSSIIRHIAKGGGVIRGVEGEERGGGVGRGVGCYPDTTVVYIILFRKARGGFRFASSVMALSILPGNGLAHCGAAVCLSVCVSGSVCVVQRSYSSLLTTEQN